jgi:hypothetical protein
LMTVDEYHRLGEEGVLDEDARVEVTEHLRRRAGQRVTGQALAGRA